MSMSTSVKGFRPPDERWHKMKAIYDSCRAADIEVPDEVLAFFNYIKPDDRGMEVDIMDTCVTHYNDHEGRVGYDVDIRNLPKDVYIIRFYNSW